MQGANALPSTLLSVVLALANPISLSSYTKVQEEFFTIPEIYTLEL